MKKRLSILLCLLIALTPLCAMAQKFPKNPIPEASATPEPPPSSLAPFYEDDHPAPGMKWVSLQGEYEMLVPEGWQEESVEDDELGLYYAVFDEEAGCGIALMCLKEMSGITMTPDIVDFVFTDEGAQRIDSAGIANDIPMALYFVDEGSLQGVMAVFEGVNFVGCHVVFFVAADVEAFIEEVGEFCLENIRRV